MAEKVDAPSYGAKKGGWKVEFKELVARGEVDAPSYGAKKGGWKVEFKELVMNL